MLTEPAVIVSPSGLVMLTPASTTLAALFSRYVVGPAELTSVGASATHVTVIDTVAVEPPGARS